MKNILLINSSGRVTRSLTRRLAQRFINAIQADHTDVEVTERDVTRQPPPVVDEPWIAAAFGHGDGGVLQASDTLIEELIAADLIVIGVPIYNFGMPAPLKAYVDQVVRIGRTFQYDPAAENPYLPLLADKPVVVIVSAGDGEMHPGGTLSHLNFLEPHLAAVLGFVGLTSLTFVRIGHEEFKDERFRQSVADAEAAVDALAARFASSTAAALPRA
jgi:FMN-dependent NADH-azoreductase